MIFLLYTAVIGSLAVGTSTVIGASVYDVFETNNRRAFAAHPYRRIFRKRPQISIIILTKNNQDTVKNCLRSIASNSYRNYQIIVVDNASSDKTTKIIKDFGLNYPKKSVQLVSKRRSTDRRRAISAGFKHATGELVVVLDGSDALALNYLKTAARSFALNEPVKALMASSVPIAYPNVLGITQLFKYFGQSEFYKFVSLLHLSRTKLISSGNVYRHSALKQALNNNSPITFSYISDLIIHRQATKNYMDVFNNQTERPSGLVNLVKQISADSLVLFTWTYIIYLALGFKTVFFLTLSWLAFSIFMAFALWNAQVIKTGQKLKLSFLIPIIYSLFYIFLVIDLISLLRKILLLYVKTINRISRHFQLVSR